MESGLLLSASAWASPHFWLSTMLGSTALLSGWAPETCRAEEKQTQRCKPLPAGRCSLLTVWLLLEFMKQHGGSISAGPSLMGLCAVCSVMPHVFLGFPCGVAQLRCRYAKTRQKQHRFVLWKCLEIPVMGKEEFVRCCWLLWHSHDGTGGHIELPTLLATGLEPPA